MTIAPPRTAPEQHVHDPRTCKLLPCVLYMRLSDARNENGSFEDREAALRERAERLGWCVVRAVIENDVINGTGGERSTRASAFKRRRVKMPDGRVKMLVWRPGFRSILDDLARGRARAVLAEDLDRTLRDPRDCEDMIDTVQATGSHADSLSGSLRFTAGGTDSERAMARVMVAMNNKASADTARRVSDGRGRKAAKSEFGGGRRPYGFGVPKENERGEPVIDYSAVVPEEAAEIQRWAEAVLSGVPLRSVARDMITRDVPTVTGIRWTSQTVRDILLRPRTAGHVVYRSEAARERSRNATDPAEKLPTHYTDAEIVGTLPGDPILPDDVWRAVVARLTDPAAVVTWTDEKGGVRTAVRGTNVGRAPCYLGTGLYLCGGKPDPDQDDTCGAPVSVLASKSRPRAYRCEVKGTGHVVRNLAGVDGEVLRWVVARMSRPDAAELLAAPADSGVDVGALRAEVAVLRQRKADLAAAFAEGDIDRAQLAAGTKRIAARLADAEAKLAVQTDRSPLAPLAGVDDVRATWDTLSLGAQRAIIAELVTVTILPTGRLGRGFDPASVRIEPRA